jgi:cytochrome c553
MILRLVSLVASLALAASAIHAQDFDAAAEAETCAACHGADGVPAVPEAPIIWGQQFYYLYLQLRDYASGLRSHETMSPLAANYNKEQQQALATYFSEKPWPRVPAEITGEAARQAQGVIAAGECSQCHSTFEGLSGVPRLAGQSASYLDRTLLDFKNRVRMNAPDKAFLMEEFSDEDLHAVAAYLATL